MALRRLVSTLGEEIEDREEEILLLFSQVIPSRMFASWLIS